jgi:hypothetical protein
MVWSDGAKGGEFRFLGTVESVFSCTIMGTGTVSEPLLLHLGVGRG